MVEALTQEIGKKIGFPDDDLCQRCLKAGINKFDDKYMCLIGIFCSMSSDEEIQGKAKIVLNKLKTKHDRSGPFMLLKWIIQIQDGKDNGNLEKQIEEWSQLHNDELLYSRVILWLKQTSKDNVELIDAYVKHLDSFWKDALVWAKLGELYAKEKLYDRSVFCYDEAIGLDSENAMYYKNSAKYRLLLGSNKDIAVKQLAKSVMLNEKDPEAWDLLIKNSKNSAKYVEYKEKILKL